MICAPVETIDVYDGTNSFKSDSLAISTVFSDIAEKFAGENGVVYDIQKLPYCPVQQIELVNDELDYSLYKDSKRNFIVTSNGNNVGIIFACSVSNFSGSIELNKPVIMDNLKMRTICDRYRIVSPNYNGIFEFNPVKNGGLSSLFYYCTYKPFSPFIHVTPDFDYLYGQDFADNRGLICGGDFSMPIITSAWETYQRQNKNFQEVFDRGIQSLDLQQNVARSSDIISAITGTVTASVAGAASGYQIGGGTGAAVGGVVSGITSGIGGILGYQMNEALRQDTRDYRISTFDLNLGNIKALPMSLSKSSAFVFTNKIWPFLEYYTCSDEEKKSVANALRWEGMKVGRIDLFGNYTPEKIKNGFYDYYDGITNKCFIKGTLIYMDIDGLNEEYHLVNFISSELNKGVYIENE